jgi:hypothetical protein
VEEKKRWKSTPFFAVPDAGFEFGEGARVEGGLAEYYVGLKDCTLVVRFGSTDSDSVTRTAP